MPGDFQAVDSDLTGLALFSLRSRAYRWYEPGGEFGPDEAVAFFAEVLLRNILLESVL